MLKVLDLFSASQVPLAGSASGQAERGKSGRAPSTYSAPYSSRIARRHCGGARAYARCPEPDVRHMTGRRAGHQESGGRNGSGFHLAHAFGRLVHNKLPCALDCERKTLNDSLGRSSRHIHASNAIDSHRLDCLSQRPHRIADNTCELGRPPSFAAIETSLCIPPNTILRLLDQRQTRSRKTHSVS